VIDLVASAAVAFGTLSGPTTAPTMMRDGVGLGGSGSVSGPPRAAANLPGNVMSVSLTNTGAAMMGDQGNARMGGVAMGLSRLDGPQRRTCAISREVCAGKRPTVPITNREGVSFHSDYIPPTPNVLAGQRSVSPASTVR
jgi:hypothetical protein